MIEEITQLFLEDDNEVNGFDYWIIFLKNSVILSHSFLLFQLLSDIEHNLLADNTNIIPTRDYNAIEKFYVRHNLNGELMTRIRI